MLTTSGFVSRPNSAPRRASDATLAAWIRFLLGRHAMFGHDPPSHLLFEVHAWILCNDSRPEIFGKRLVSDTEHIQAYSVVQELHLQRLVGSDPGCCV